MHLNTADPRDLRTFRHAAETNFNNIHTLSVGIEFRRSFLAIGNRHKNTNAWVVAQDVDTSMDVDAAKAIVYLWAQTHNMEVHFAEEVRLIRAPKPDGIITP